MSDQSCLNCRYCCHDHEHGEPWATCIAPIPACALDGMNENTARTINANAPYGKCACWREAQSAPWERPTPAPGSSP